MRFIATDYPPLKKTFYIQERVSPGHNHFWILDDVTNMDVVAGHRGNSIITLFEP